MANTLAKRFWSKVTRTDGCWGWTASVKKFGYGQVWSGIDGGPMLFAHRVSWEIHFGPVPDGALVLHRCDNPPCCNPSHLFLGTKADNNADMAEKGRAWNPLAERNRGATHCPQGHEYTPENTYDYSGGRKCKTCVRKRRADYRARNLDAVRESVKRCAKKRRERANHSRPPSQPQTR